MKTLFLLALCVFIYGCERETVIVIEPNLPKIDCDEYLNRVHSDLGAAGIATSGAGKQVLEKERNWCADENKRRGY